MNEYTMATVDSTTAAATYSVVIVQLDPVFLYDV